MGSCHARIAPLKPSDPVPSPRVCPITLDPIVDPVRTCDGYVYERAAIEQWFKINSRRYWDTIDREWFMLPARSPMTGLRLANLILVSVR
jgi:hypothetical protein